MKKILVIILCLLFITGCSVQKDDKEKIRDIPFTVTSESKIPEELVRMIEEKKQNPFEITYGEEGYLYIAKGYGTKESSGYSIEVEECYETSNLICVRTNLLGPPKGEEIQEVDTFPYIVIKIEYSEKYVEFE